uniref:Uncharacterized protein n=1 Tax=Spongospora subterranea TaxID=70186 RepID=A0A0H5QMF4_9EUKA|eukprot:CRZ02757.1 hypothetical protein [Spongospora subterranea]
MIASAFGHIQVISRYLCLFGTLDFSGYSECELGSFFKTPCPSQLSFSHQAYFIMMSRPWVNLIFSHLLFCAHADIYMHNPRGSNNRNREPADNRDNNNLMFDSQNNAAGGYSWAGDPKFQGRPDPLIFYSGSQLRLEWTVQHGCGPNSNTQCDFIIQYMSSPAADNVIRDGYPTGPLTERAPGYNAATFVDPKQNARGTRTFPLPPSFPGASNEQFAADDPDFGTAVDSDVRAKNFNTFCNGGAVGPHRGLEFGYHESCESYKRCTMTERNQGLYHADRALGGTNARFTRQNQNGNRNGLECAEERDYYPYWRHSEWKDVAIMTSNLSWCATAQKASQNIKERYYCQLPPTATALAPITEVACQKLQGTWVQVPSWGLTAPRCVEHETTRDNHLGNSGSQSFDDQNQPGTSSYTWTIPPSLRGQRVVLRFRYNISATTYESHGEAMNSKMTTSSLDCKAGLTGVNGGAHCSNDLNLDGPVALYNNPYVKLWDSATEKDGMNHVYLALALNTAQVGRTFQDRSFVFEVREEEADCAGDVVNLNVRGKRGNIVQTYPATEYDFVPSFLQLTSRDCVDIQWVGSDFNQANQDGEGADQTDRHNIVEVRSSNLDPSNPDYSHLIPQTGSRIRMFSQKDAKLLAYANQTLSSCANLIEDNNDNREKFDNCAKLNAAPNVYRHPELVSFSAGSYLAMATRNNNFSNRQQKLHLLVKDALSVGVYLAGAVVATIAVATMGVCCFARRRPKSPVGRAINAIFLGHRAFQDKYQDVPETTQQNQASGNAVNIV